MTFDYHLVVLVLPTMYVDPTSSMSSYLVSKHASIPGNDAHWCSINWDMYDIYLSFVPASIICSLNDVIHEDLDVGDGSIECQFEWSDNPLIDSDVSFGGGVQDLIRRHLSSH